MEHPPVPAVCERRAYRSGELICPEHERSICIAHLEQPYVEPGSPYLKPRTLSIRADRPPAVLPEPIPECVEVVIPF